MFVSRLPIISHGAVIGSRAVATLVGVGRSKPTGGGRLVAFTGERLFGGAHRPFHRAMATAARLKEAGIVLPPKQGSQGQYLKCIRDGDMVYTTGHFGQDENAKTVAGKVGTGSWSRERSFGFGEFLRSGLSILQMLRVCACRS